MPTLKKNAVQKLSLTKKNFFLALPVTEIPFPTFTICPQGQHYTVFLASIFNLFFKYLKKAKNITQKLTPYKAAKLYAKDTAKLVRYLDLDIQADDTGWICIMNMSCVSTVHYSDEKN